MLTELRIGIDDTDSPKGGCTTYIGTLLFQELTRHGFIPIDFPFLVRLNPNIPWKTRGNGAVALSFLVDETDLEQIKETTLRIVRANTDPSISSTDPAIVLLKGSRPQILREFSQRALYDVLRIGEARRIANKAGVEVHLLNKPRGIIGALAAVGTELNQHTFEIIAYRTKDKLGTPRSVDANSVREMDTRYRESTFNNVDPETGRILICPHGPDPVLFGIRGEDPESVLGAFASIRADEPIERFMIFKTNSGTDAHLDCQRSIIALRPCMSAAVSGRVETPGRVLRGGHLIFSLRDATGVIDCAAYEPLGRFRSVVGRLVPGDSVRVFGGVRRGPEGRITLNLEKIEIVRLTTSVCFVNPTCSGCGLRCESMGRGQGFRCRRCDLRFRSASRVPVIKSREISAGMFIPPARAHRHLTKPLSRMPMSEPRSPLRDTSCLRMLAYGTDG